MDTPQNDRKAPAPHWPWVRFAVALAIVAVLVVLFEAVPRRGQGFDSGRLARVALVAVAAAAFISFGAGRKTPQ